MVIRFEPALTCMQYLTRDKRPCGHLATSGVITGGEGDSFEFLPVCAMHLNELLLSLPAPRTEASTGCCLN